MATMVAENPFDTQPPKAINSGLVNAGPLGANSGGAGSPGNGLVGSAMLTTAAPTSGQMPANVGTSAPVTPNVATFSPTTRNVNAQTETAQGQVESILSKDSPLMQRARTLATQQMAQRRMRGQ